MSMLTSILPSQLQAFEPKHLQHFTYARIGLGKKGVSIPLKDVLAFKADHAAARDAIFAPFECGKLKQELSKEHVDVVELFTLAHERHIYLQRPDLGRLLDNSSEQLLKEWRNKNPLPIDIAITVTDGLSAMAVNRHAVPLLRKLCPALQKAGYNLSPVLFLHHGRVAASDPIGELLGAKLSLILVGERPGLSSPDSLGAYFTYGPRCGNTDERRNCISNIRPQGLHYDLAAEKIFYLVHSSLTKRISGVELKDEKGLLG